MRILTITKAVVLVSMGFVAGWIGSSRWGAEQKEWKLDLASKRAAILEARSFNVAPQLREPPLAAGGAPPVISRLQALAWVKTNAVPYLSVGVFSKNGLEPSFVATFGLSSDEQRKLEAVIATARNQILALQRASAIIARPSGTDTLVVEIPEQPLRGGAIYDQVVDAFRTVLGPERYQYFDSVAGTTFDNGFDSFGAQKTKFEVSVETNQGGELMYSIKKSYWLLGSSGTSSGTVPPSQLRQFYPVLEGLIPVDLKTRK